MTDKLIYWVGSSRDELSNFPKEARRKAGRYQEMVQFRHEQKGK